MKHIVEPSERKHNAERIEFRIDPDDESTFLVAEIIVEPGGERYLQIRSMHEVLISPVVGNVIRVFSPSLYGKP